MNFPVRSVTVEIPDGLSVTGTDAIGSFVPARTTVPAMEILGGREPEDVVGDGGVGLEI